MHLEDYYVFLHTNILKECETFPEFHISLFPDRAFRKLLYGRYCFYACSPLHELYDYPLPSLLARSTWATPTHALAECLFHHSSAKSNYDGADTCQCRKYVVATSDYIFIPSYLFLCAANGSHFLSARTTYYI